MAALAPTRINTSAELAVACAARTLRAVARSGLFDAFSRADAEAAVQQLVGRVLAQLQAGAIAGADAGAPGQVGLTATLEALSHVLPPGMATLQLVVEATVVRDVNVGRQGEGEDERGSCSSASSVVGSGEESEDVLTEEEGGDHNPLVGAGPRRRAGGRGVCSSGGRSAPASAGALVVGACPQPAPDCACT